VLRKGPVVRFETPPGQQAQCDFGELAIHEVCGTRTKIHLFVMVLGFSRYMYAEAAADARSQSFLACHARAFSYFGGMPREVLYDNAKIVALEHWGASFRFAAAPEVVVRPLSVYEEAAR
jgi:transposase